MDLQCRWPSNVLRQDGVTEREGERERGRESEREREKQGEKEMGREGMNNIIGE